MADFAWLGRYCRMGWTTWRGTAPFADFAAFHSFRCRSRTVLMEDPVRGYRYL